MKRALGIAVFCVVLFIVATHIDFAYVLSFGFIALVLGLIFLAASINPKSPS